MPDSEKPNYDQILEDVEGAIRLRLIRLRVTSAEFSLSLVPSKKKDDGWQSSKTVWEDDYKAIIAHIRLSNPHYSGVLKQNPKEREKSFKKSLAWLVASIANRIDDIIN